MWMLCPICAGEFQKKLDLCPGCGCGLVPSSMRDRAVREQAKEVAREVEFVELCRPLAHPVAMLVKQMLEQNGVAALVQGGHSLSLLPHLAFMGELRIMIDRSHLEFARALYAAYFEGDGETDFIEDS